MIYIVYEYNKTVDKELIEKRKPLSFLLESNMNLAQTKIREEEQESFHQLFYAMCEEVTDYVLDQQILSIVHLHMQEIKEIGISHVGAYHMKHDHENFDVLCFENTRLQKGTGVQFVLYQSDENKSISYHMQGELLQVFINVAYKEENSLLHAFALAMYLIMSEEPSMKLLDFICSIHPLFTQTMPFIIMFLCDGKYVRMQVEAVPNKMKLWH